MPDLVHGGKQKLQ